jgi:hypothetical protein
MLGPSIVTCAMAHVDVCTWSQMQGDKLSGVAWTLLLLFTKPCGTACLAAECHWRTTLSEDFSVCGLSHGLLNGLLPITAIYLLWEATLPFKTANFIFSVLGSQICKCQRIKGLCLCDSSEAIRKEENKPQQPHPLEHRKPRDVGTQETIERAVL